MPILERNNKPALHYVVDDFTDPWRNAPYLILQHGNGRSSQFWYRWVPYLARFYKVVRPDVRGLGKSSAEFNLEREFTLEHCVGDLVDIINDLGKYNMDKMYLREKMTWYVDVNWKVIIDAFNEFYLG